MSDAEQDQLWEQQSLKFNEIFDKTEKALFPTPDTITRNPQVLSMWERYREDASDTEAECSEMSTTEEVLVDFLRAVEEYLKEEYYKETL